MAGSATASKLTPHAVDDDVREPVKEELSRILQHPLFKDTTRMKRFLRYVVEEALAGRDDRLKGYSIGLEVFDRPDDFDPQADTIVRVQAGQLRRRLDLYYAGDGRNNPVRILIPKGRYSPVFEMRRNVSADDASMAVIAKIESQNRPGIAVLTFEDLTVEKTTDYFAEGLTAEIVNALVQFRYLRVVARTATVTSHGAPLVLSEIAKANNVNFVLSGNIRRVDTLIRISINLLSSKTGEHIYSKIFDREYTPKNLWEVQEEIASYIAANIAAPFGAVNRYNRRQNTGRISSATAYEAFLKYYEMSISPSENMARELLSEFEAITDKTPRFSSAWAARALLNCFLVAQCIPVDNGAARLEAAIKEGTRASAIDPENALAFSALFQAYYHSGNVELAEKMADSALALNPNDYNMLAYYAITLAARGESRQAASYHAAAMGLIARPPTWFYICPLLIALQAREFEKVAELVKDVTVESSGAIQFLYLVSMGHLDRAKEAKPLVEALLARNADYGRHTLESMLYWQPNADLLSLAHEGWRKVGLDVPDSL